MIKSRFIEKTKEILARQKGGPGWRGEGLARRPTTRPERSPKPSHCGGSSLPFVRHGRVSSGRASRPGGPGSYRCSVPSPPNVECEDPTPCLSQPSIGAVFPLADGSVRRMFRYISKRQICLKKQLNRSYHEKRESSNDSNCRWGVRKHPTDGAALKQLIPINRLSFNQTHFVVFGFSAIRQLA